MPGETAAIAPREGAVVRVDVSDQILCDVAFPIARRDGARIHAAAVARERVGQHDDHLASSGRVIRRVRQIESTDVCLGGRRVAVQEYDDGITPLRVARVARRQIDEDVTCGVVAL
jgi:hypothetical protein